MKSKFAAKRTYLFILILILAACFVHGQEPERKIALVIGNSDYQHLSELRNPVSDAEDISAALERLGFDVNQLTNGDKDAMELAILEFGEKLRSGNGVGIFYYAGHGVQSRGTNYLLPVDIDIDTESQLRIKAVETDLVLEFMNDAENPFNMIILDACRNNPFEGTFRAAGRGLAVIETLPKGSLIVYATQPGNVAEDGIGRNGTFTSALLEYIESPGIDVLQMFSLVGKDVAYATNDRQRPWIHTDFYGSFSFVEDQAPSQPAGVTIAEATAGDDAADGDEESKTGQLFIVTNPEGAEISINGEDKGTSPLFLQSLPLLTNLAITARIDNMIGTETVKLEGEDLKDIIISLEVETGNLIIISKEKDLIVYLDQNRLGEFGTGLFREITAGIHEIELKGDGLYWRDEVGIAANATVQITAAPIEVGSISYNVPGDAKAVISGDDFSEEVTGNGSLENVRVGGYTAHATGPGYEPETIQIAVSRGETSTLELFNRGNISVETKPAGASVYIGGLHRGVTPVTVSDVNAGYQDVEVRKSGYAYQTQKVYVDGGKTVEVKFMQLRPAVGEDFLLVKAGTFQMGSESGLSDEKPVHSVRLDRSFYMSKYEVTFEQYDEFCKATGRETPDDRGWGRGTHPVINVSWYDAVEYCNWLSRKEGLTAAYSGSGGRILCNFSADGYRLPTEAEWEYAARGGLQSKGLSFAGGESADEAGWGKANADGSTHEVGTLRPNEIGLYDMSGNVLEWCWDIYSADYYETSPGTNPFGSDDGVFRVLRGGCWYDEERLLQSTIRFRSHPDFKSRYFGFRIVRNVE